MTIRNTTKDSQSPLGAMLFLADAMTNRDGGSGFIEAQEAAGQRQLVNSDRLPTNSSNTDEEFAALGITLGPADPSDPLFRPATLPPGWKREGTDHSMHSNVVDELGRTRVGVFYKAAFYDRRADMHIITRSGYLRTCLWNKATPVLDDTWLTAEVALNILAELRDGEFAEATRCDEYAANGHGDVEYWAKRSAEHRNEAAEYDSMAEAIRGAR